MFLRAAGDTNNKIKRRQRFNIIAKTGTGPRIKGGQLQFRGVVKNRHASSRDLSDQVSKETGSSVAIDIRHQKDIARSHLILQPQCSAENQPTGVADAILTSNLRSSNGTRSPPEWR